MNRDEILARVADAMTDLFDLERELVRADARLREDLDLDSLDAVDLAAELQRITGRRLEDKDLRRIRTVGDIVDVVARDLAATR
ncbi:MAG: acyl carrier protein [Polyangiales bacterium]